MPLWMPDYQVVQGVITLSRRNTASFTYKLDGLDVFPASTTATIKFYNTYGQQIGLWNGVVSGGQLDFDQPPAAQEMIPAGTTWELVANYAGTTPRLLMQGLVVRDEARYPNEPVNSGVYDALQYEYTFVQPGAITDPAWRVINGAPTVWENPPTGPNGAAAGIFFDDAAMMWYAPMGGDSIKINYTLRDAGSGKTTLGMCSNYDGTNWLGITHERGINNNFLKVEIGTSPVTMATQATQAHTLTGVTNYTAYFNALTNTVSVYKGTDLTPIMTPWTDTANLVDHGPGERYFIFNWRASLFAPGPELVNFKIIDAE